ncbi:MAG: hypothetical protein IPJ13_10430 [Saprospiraceae bacterium]|nr:hypothetical protein [Saprospiraceae bacterium]
MHSWLSFGTNQTSGLSDSIEMTAIVLLKSVTGNNAALLFRQVMLFFSHHLIQYIKIDSIQIQAQIFYAYGGIPI